MKNIWLYILLFGCFKSLSAQTYCAGDQISSTHQNQEHIVGAGVEGYEVGGKTGTALKYNSKATLNTFVSLFPASRPKFALLVMIIQTVHQVL